MKLKFFKHSEQQGVALVITLIMLAVVTFLAIAYLAMSRRDQASVITQEEKNRAQLMADAGFEHLKAKVIANILAYTNASDYDLIVSTNFNNPNSWQFLSGCRYPEKGYLTNVCLYDTNGLPIPWSVDALRVSLGNLQVDPVVPVFYSVLASQKYTNDFRFYLDFNRNGVFEPTRMTNETLTSSTKILQWGDPQWIGVLEHPNLPHSPTNRFIGRFAYLGVPVGKTLDINYIHNNTKNRAKTLNRNQLAFQRNQGVGSWELNLAAFFRELNPLQWRNDEYIYFSQVNQYSRGVAFEDAQRVLEYRYNGNYNNLKGLSDYSWVARPNAYDRIGELLYKNQVFSFNRNDIIENFTYDIADNYSDGPLMQTAFMFGKNQSEWNSWDDDTEARLNDPWVGSDNPRKLFDIQDLVDESKFDIEMVERLHGTYENRHFTDAEHYLTNSVAFYKLLAQMSADSVYTADSRIPLNYMTVAESGKTNFIPWTANIATSSNFFYKTADKLLMTEFNLHLTNVQVFPTNQYSAAVHRVFQLTANIYDAMTNQAPRSQTGPSLPSVFRPIYRVQDNAVFLSGFEVVTNNVEDYIRNDTFVRLVYPHGTGDINWPDVTVATFKGYENSEGQIRRNLIGMPWVIAARKGYPSFNEQELLTDIQLTRKVGLTRQNKAGVFQVQNMWVQYMLGISNRIAIEAWNPYQSDEYDFNRSLTLRVTNKVSTALWYGTNRVKVSTATNSYGVPTKYEDYVVHTLWTNVPASKLNKWEHNVFNTLISSNLVLTPPSIIEFEQSGGAYYSTNIHGKISLEPKNPSTFYRNANFLGNGPLYMTITNLITYIAIDYENDRIVDYVSMEKTNLFNVNQLIRGNSGIPGGTDGGADQSYNAMLWDPYLGVQRQLDISLGESDDHNTWQEYSSDNVEKSFQIAGFRQFCGLTNSSEYDKLVDNQGLFRMTPYNPTVHKVVIESLQVNDPFVHYHIQDLVNFTNVYSPSRIAQENSENDPSNIGIVNDFYVPWGGNPNKDITGYRESVNRVGIKDQNLVNADYWDFPTNWYGRPFAYPTLGWLGKIHRGTPWQSVYLKSDIVEDNIWSKWIGRSESHPTNDWRLMDIFTTAINKNAARGLLSVNQTNAAAWAAVLCGVNVLTDTNNSVVIEPQTEQFHQIVQGINETRASRNGGTFSYQGEILSAPVLSLQSPYLGSGDVNDATLEWLPMQIMSLLKEDNPAFLVYSYGQALSPAPGATVLAPGQYRGMVTNYVVTAEYATKTLFRLENAPNAPKVVIESFDILPME